MQKKKINFPLKYNLKVILANSTSITPENSIVPILKSYQIEHTKLSATASKSNTYTSYTYKVEVPSQEIFDGLYENLSKVPAVKMVI